MHLGRYFRLQKKRKFRRVTKTLLKRTNFRGTFAKMTMFKIRKLPIQKQLILLQFHKSFCERSRWLPTLGRYLDLATCLLEKYDLIRF